MFIVFIYSRNDVIYNSYQQKKQDWPFVNPHTSIEPTATKKNIQLHNDRERGYRRKNWRKDIMWLITCLSQDAQ